MIYDDILEGLDGNDTLDGGSDKKVAQIKV